MSNKSKALFFFLVFLFLSVNLLETDVLARFGRGGSFGSRGSRSSSSPSRSYSTRPANPGPGMSERTPYGPSFPQQPGGGFLRGIGGGIMGGLLGGFLGNMLFGRMGAGFGGSGIGLFEILLFAGIGYLIFRMLRKRKMSTEQSYSCSGQSSFQDAPRSSSGNEAGIEDGLTVISRTDPNFSAQRFSETATDLFFKIQAAWMNKDLSGARSCFTEEMQEFFQKELNSLIREKKTNHLENIAVRGVEITEAWQEAGRDFITVRFSANVLDYTTDDNTGAVIEGSKTDPVKFEEYWTFARNTGSREWQLSGVNQV